MTLNRRFLGLWPGQAFGWAFNRVLGLAFVSVAVLGFFPQAEALAQGTENAPGAAASPGAAKIAENLSGKAETAFREGRFKAAIEFYQASWEVVPTAEVLYNIAFIYDQKLNDSQNALDYYERVIATRNVDPELVQLSNGRIVALQTRRAQESLKATPPKDLDNEDDDKEGAEGDSDKARSDDPKAGEQDDAQERSDAAEAALSKTKPKDEIVVPRVAPSQSSNGAIWGATSMLVAGTGVALGGLSLGLLAQTKESDFHDGSRSLYQRKNAQMNGKDQALYGDIMMLGGGALAISGLIWLIVDLSSSDASEEASVDLSQPTRLEPFFQEDGGGILVKGGLW